MKKKITALVLFCAMTATLLAGCGTTEESESTQSTSTGTSTSTTASTTADSTEENAITEITLYTMTLGNNEGVQEVEDAVNAISEEKIGVHVNFNIMDMDSYINQMSLMLAGGETADLILITPIGNIGFNTLVSQNQLTDISDLLNTYAPDLVSEMGDYLPAMENSKGQMGVPGYRLLNSDMYVTMRADILDELGLRDEAEAMDSWSDLEAIFEMVYENQDTLPESMQTTAIIGNSGSTGDVITSQPAMAGADSWSEAKGYDTLGDALYVIGVDDTTDTVFNWYATDDFYEEISRVKDWYDKGWVYKDAGTSQDSADTNMKNGVVFASVSFSEPGIEVSKKSSTGYEVVCKKISTGPVTTGSGASWGWGVPITAEEPEAAVSFLNLLYTDPDVENLLVYGIEGRDYDLNEEGEAVVREDASYTSNDFLWGNQFNAYPQEGQGSDFRESSLAEMEEAGISKYYGCTIDSEAVSGEVTAINAVIQQYYPSLVSGGVTDLDESYQTFLQALEDAGVETYMQTYQDTLDSWLSEQGE